VQALPVVELVLAAGDVNGARQGPGWRRRMPSGSAPTSEHAVVPGIKRAFVSMTLVVVADFPKEPDGKARQC
jgi:hypothetical protein